MGELWGERRDNGDFWEVYGGMVIFGAMRGPADNEMDEIGVRRWGVWGWVRDGVGNKI